MVDGRESSLLPWVLGRSDLSDGDIMRIVVIQLVVVIVSYKCTTLQQW